MTTALESPAVTLEPGSSEKAVSSEPQTNNNTAATTSDVINTATAASAQGDAVSKTETATGAAQQPEKANDKTNGSAASPAAAVEDDGVNPVDFQGSVDSNNDLPSAATLRKIEDYVVLDRDGKSHTFKSLYTGKHVARRVLLIFVRHFFCGNCQEYLRTLAESITPEALLRLPVSTFIAVIGCGDPGLIEMYATATECPFPIYADPTRRLYTELGMVRTLALGTRPAYMRKSLLRSSLASIAQGLRQIRTGLVTKSGDQRQIGGEFLFEPAGLLTPITSPKSGGSASQASPPEVDELEEKKVTWCHRMKNTRDHAEIPELMEVLGLDGDGMPIADGGKDGGKRWSKALEERKGTGLSMASQMAALKTEAAFVAPAPAAV